MVDMLKDLCGVRLPGGLEDIPLQASWKHLMAMAVKCRP